jgi:cytochrome oxidase Cu insertion factor (SCO1/SenC/PrrC family)
MITETAPTDAEPEEPRSEERWRFPRWLTFGLLPFFLSMAAAMAVTAYVERPGSYTGSLAGPPGIPPGVTSLLVLSQGAETAAPGFSLVDQQGRQLRLAQLRGRAVVLAFLDPRCGTPCRHIGPAIRQAERQLGPLASRVAFVAVDVNRNAASTGALATFGRRHGLSRLANWYFLSGSRRALASVYGSYGEAVVQPRGSGRPDYTEYLYFIDRRGNERYVADPAGPIGSRASAVRWGNALATVLRKTLG